MKATADHVSGGTFSNGEKKVLCQREHRYHLSAISTYFNFDDLLPDFEDNYAEAPVLITFDDGMTGIGNVPSGKGEMTGGRVIYNLNGQRVESPEKGLYIINNKKVVVK